ncbi:transcriptional regulator [Clostridium beijerinckii]|nr:transcriptional regulator [Clostridium beijerinckii]
MSFQEQLQTLRKAKGLSQEKLAEFLGISRQAVAKWEVGQSYPDIARLIALSDFFKVSIDKLVNDYEENCRLCIEENKVDNINENIIDFLCRAKKSTYAGGGIENKSSRPNSHDLEYVDGNLKYIDTYLGGERFSGEEGLWQDDIPFWSMNYSGRVLDERFSGNFLKEALSLVTEDNPYRGPIIYQNGQYKYHCIINGEFNWFQGYEEIYFDEIKVYECYFHGGSIK